MTDAEWVSLVAQLRLLDEGSVRAAAELQRRSSTEDVPRLIKLLDDPVFFVREAAAWALSDLGVTEGLSHLLRAAARGESEGLDNDGMHAALTDLVEAHPDAASIELKALMTSSDARVRDYATWLIEFCGKGGAA